MARARTIERMRSGRNVCLIVMLAVVGSLQCGASARDRSPAVGASADTSKGITALVRGSLIGEHKLTLQWLGFGDLSQAGNAVIAPEGDELSLKGEQTGVGEESGGYVRIDGRIVSADQEGFVFMGDILTRVSHIAEGAECRRSGTFHFQTRGVRKYWRLQEMESPCSTVTDYVDIYFIGV